MSLLVSHFSSPPKIFFFIWGLEGVGGRIYQNIYPFKSILFIVQYVNYSIKGNIIKICDVKTLYGKPTDLPVLRQMIFMGKYPNYLNFYDCIVKLYLFDNILAYFLLLSLCFFKAGKLYV